METKPKNVIVLTGFLGSGKTTLLNAILKVNPGKRYAIIENEVGEIGIDGELIIKNSDSFTELSNGCICCSLNDNFTDTLRNLSKRSDWDELIIEATGVAHPGGIIAPFKQFPWMSKYFNLPDVICIADAQNIEEQLKISDTAPKQLAYGDKVYISKSDLVDAERVEEIKHVVQKFNPFAQFYYSNQDNLVQNILKPVSSNKPVISIGNVVKPSAESETEHDMFESVALEFDYPIDENKLFSRLYTFLMVQAFNVYRLKGIFHDSRKDHKLIIQSVMKSLFIDDGEEWEEEEPKVSKFVFIGKGLKPKGFEKMIRDCRLKD